jgi:ferric-dicitrate binding protein FerR (iron transport regulator)
MAREVMAVRIDKTTRARVARVARRRGQPTSEAIRQAIESWVEQQEAELTPYERVADIIGSFEGPGDLSAGGGRRVGEMLKARREKQQRKR